MAHNYVTVRGLDMTTLSIVTPTNYREVQENTLPKDVLQTIWVGPRMDAQLQTFFQDINNEIQEAGRGM